MNNLNNTSFHFSPQSSFDLDRAWRYTNNEQNIVVSISATDIEKGGYVMRKCCIDHNAMKIHFLKRSWKMFFIAIKDMVLYCFKDENSLTLKGKFHEEIKLSHALAERAFDYTKHEFVFRLYTSDQVDILS